MSVRQVAVIEPTEEKVIQRRREGWGKRGQMAGAVIGGVVGGMAAAAGTGGAGTAVGAMGGAAAGSSLGGMIGERMRPGREQQTAIERRAAAAPQVKQSDAVEKLKQSLSALSTQPPEIQQQYLKPLTEAYATALQNQNRSGGMA